MANTTRNINFYKVIDRDIDHVYLTDSQAQVTYSNGRIQDLLGYSVDEFIGIDLQDIIYPDDVAAAIVFFNDVCQSAEETKQIELRGQHKAGHYVWFEVLAINLLHEADVNAIVIRARDITRLKQYQHMVERQTDLICRFTPELMLTFTNEAYANFFNQKPGTMVGRNLLDVIPPEEQASVKAHFASITQANPIAIFQNRWILPDGSRRWFEWTDRAIFDDEGNIIEYQGVGRDINDRKILELERERHTAETEALSNFLQTTLDAFPAYTLVLEPDGTIINANAAWKAFADANNMMTDGYFVDNQCFTICGDASNMPSDELSAITAGIREVIAGQSDLFNHEYPCNSQTENRWYEMRVTPFPEPAPRRVVVAHFDVSELRNAETALRENEKRFRLIAEHANDIILESDGNGIIRYISPAATLLTQNPDAFIGKTHAALVEFIHPDDLGRIIQVVGEATATLTPTHYEYRHRIHETQNEYIWLDVSLAFVESNGDFQGRVTVSRNITERKLAEDALRQSERRFRLIAEHAHDIILQYDANGIIQYVSPSAKSLSQNIDSFIGQHYDALAPYTHPDDVDRLFSSIPKVNASLQPLRYEYRHRVHDTDDTYVWLEVFRSYLTDTDGKLQSVVTISRDITERKAAEHELQAL